MRQIEIATLPPGDHRRLVGAFGLLASPIAGERHAAADAVHRIATKHRVDLAALFQPPPRSPAPPAPRSDDLAENLRFAGLHANRLTAWEMAFVVKVSAWNGVVSARQAQVVRSIVIRLRAEAAR